MEKGIKRDNDKSFINRLVNKYFFIIFAILILVISAITEQVLKLYNLDFRNWFRNTIFIVALISFIIGIIKINIKNKLFQKVMKSMLVVFMGLGIVGAIFWQYTIFFGYMFLKLIGFTTREYVMDTSYGKKVIYVDTFLLDTSVEIHDYYNPFFCSYSYESDTYDGSYDYIDEEKIEKSLKNKI